MIDLFYLIKNENGFEEIVTSGNKDDLEKLKSQLECKSNLEENKINQNFKTVSYYIISKKEWDLLNCPLLPVDFP